MSNELASILIGDHLGQVKKVLWPSGELSSLKDLGQPDKNNPILSIEPLDGNAHLICRKNGELYLYDPVHDKTKEISCKTFEQLIRILPMGEGNFVYVQEKSLTFISDTKKKETTITLKKGRIKVAQIGGDYLSIAGKDIPLRVFDLKTKNKIFDANFPEKDWLGIQPECDVSDLNFVNHDKVATCSKSDSVIRVYDIKSGKPDPCISINLNQTAFNEYAEAGRFISITSARGHESNAKTRTVIVGSNVGQQIAIELRFGIKSQPKKRLQSKPYKVLGGFKGSRGAAIKDISMIESDKSQGDYKVISCCLDRYVRVHNMSKTKGRNLEKHFYVKTKPICCSPVFYND